MASYLGDLGEKIASKLGMGAKHKKKGDQFKDVKSGSSSTASKGPGPKMDEDIFEQQSQMRNLVDKARKATGKQVR